MLVPFPGVVSSRAGPEPGRWGFCHEAGLWVWLLWGSGLQASHLPSLGARVGQPPVWAGLLMLRSPGGPCSPVPSLCQHWAPPGGGGCEDGGGGHCPGRGHL